MVPKRVRNERVAMACDGIGRRWSQAPRCPASRQATPFSRMTDAAVVAPSDAPHREISASSFAAIGSGRIVGRWCQLVRPESVSCSSRLSSDCATTTTAFPRCCGRREISTVLMERHREPHLGTFARGSIQVTVLLRTRRLRKRALGSASTLFGRSFSSHYDVELSRILKTQNNRATECGS